MGEGGADGDHGPGRPSGRAEGRARDAHQQRGIVSIDGDAHVLAAGQERPAWLPLLAVYAALFMGAGAPLGDALRSALVFVLPPLLRGLLVLHVPRRVRWEDERRGRFFGAQIGLTLGYAAFATGGEIGLWNLESLARTGHAIGFDALRTAWQALVSGMIYLVIAGGAYAWQSARRAREADALRARAELAVLRSQLNPHFLLNTLHASLGLVRRDPAVAERALERLGELLHYGLRMHREALDEVTLGEEWSFVTSYLEIERLRLGERLRLELQADPGLMRCPVPPFVLQPLVENAIVHAIAPRKEGGRLGITARRDGDRLHLEVRDDGPGLSASAPSGRSVGLQLLRDRLAMLYAGRAALSLEPAAGGGLRALVDLPVPPPPVGEPA